MKKLAFLLLVAFALVSCGTNEAVYTTNIMYTKATPTPKKTLKWTTIHAYKGNGIKQTEIFYVPSNWRIVWSCSPSSAYGNKYNLIAFVYDSHAHIKDVAINTMCQQGNIADITYEHLAGNIYLSIISEGNWFLRVQVLK